MTGRTYTIGEIARRSGVNARTIRRYDAVGLLKPSARSAAGYRLYEEGDIRRLDMIVALRAVGYSIPEMRSVLDEDGSAVRTAIERAAQAIDRRIERLSESREILWRAAEAQSDEEGFERVRSAVGFAESKGKGQKTAALASFRRALVRVSPHGQELQEERLDVAVQTLSSVTLTPHSADQALKWSEAAKLLQDETLLQTFAGEVQAFGERFGETIAQVDQTDWRLRMNELKNRLREAAAKGLDPGCPEAIALAKQWDQLFAQALGLTGTEFQLWRQETEKRLRETPLAELQRLASELRPHDPDKAAKRLLGSARRAGAMDHVD